LSEVATVQTGLAMGKAVNGEALELPYLRVANVQDGHLDLEVIKKVAVSRRDVDRFSLQPGDVLFTEGGDFDKLGRGTVWRGEIPICLHQNHVFAVRPSPSKLLPDFLAALASSAHGRRYFQLSSKQSTNLASINSTQLKEFPVPLPSIDLQREIAEILRTWDEALEKLTALRAAKEHQYRAFAREFFEPCHPSFHGRPNSWQEFELGDVFTERSQPGEDGERLLSVTMNGGVIDRDDVGRKDTSTEDKSRYKLVLPGDIAYNTMRMWQGVSGLSTMRGIVSPAYTVVTPRQRHLLGRYAAHLFKSRRMVFDFERYSQGLTSDTWNLKFPAFSKIKLWLPPTDEQEKQANLLDAMLSEQDVLRRQIEALTRQKRGLMQKLLTGEWRVKLEAPVA
jgi:type I restriction enzyme S subunit